MRQNSKVRVPANQLWAQILSSITLLMAFSMVSSLAYAQPALSASQPENGKGRFDKIFRKQTQIIATQNKSSVVVQNVVKDNKGSAQDDIQERIAKVIPLPQVTDQLDYEESVENEKVSDSADGNDAVEFVAVTDDAIDTMEIEDEAVTEDAVAEEAVEDDAVAVDAIGDDEATTYDPADEPPVLSEDQSDEQWPGWLTDYRNACQKAKSEQKMLFVYFYDVATDSPYTAFETESLPDENVQESLEDYVLVRIPVTTKLFPVENEGMIQLPGTEDDQKQLDIAPDDEDTDDDMTVLAENVRKTDNKANVAQTLASNAQTSSQTRYTALRPPSASVDTSKLIAPGRDLGSVEQLNAINYDLTYPNLKQETMLIRHPAFYEMLNTPGVAMIDFKHKDAEYYGKIVSVFPFLKKQPYTIDQTRAMLTLPPGTVTQRSLIFAVRIHPEKPKSTDGKLSPRLVEEARSASQYQADIRKQGHHNWDRRFQQINAILPTELLACEVCAESWEGQHLLESAIECVACWRYSEGHWSAVSAEHPYYGYDMKLGKNGVWYGTGVFGKWRHPTLAKAGTLTGGQSQQLPKRL